MMTRILSYSKHLVYLLAICAISTTTVLAQSDTVEVPKAFSPNGDDINDVFKARGSASGSFSLIVFNRWGQKVFESRDINLGWDGLDLNGNPAPADAYVYILSAQLSEETNIQKEGTVVLLR